MSVAKEAYSRRQLITVAEVASAFAKGRDIAGLEAVEQLAQAVQDGHLSADLYPPHQRWVNDGKADRIGIPAANPTEIWRSLSKKSIERHISDKDDFNYPPAALTWHLLADDVFAFANSGTLSNSAAAALRELAVRYKVEAATDAEFLRAWGIHEQIDQCKAKIQRWEHLEQSAPTPSEAITAEHKLAGLRAELAGLLCQLAGATQEQPQAAPNPAPAATATALSEQHPIEQPELTVAQVESNTAPAFAAQADQPQTTAPAESVQAAPADAPDPLTTSDVAYCFAGLRWDEQGWKKPLGDKPKWLRSCIAIPGKRGVHETRWNPVLIGAALVQDGHAKPNSVRARFQSKSQLSPWFEAWKTYEADYLDTE